MSHRSRRLSFGRYSYRRNSWKAWRLIIGASIAATAALFFLRGVSANNVTWDGGGATNNWSEAANWSGDVVPGASDVAIFDGTSTKNATMDAAGPQGANINVQAIKIATGYSGTITQAPGVTLKLTSLSSLSCGTTLFISFCQEAGTFNGGNSTLDVDGTFKLVGGVFNAPSGTTFFGSDFMHTDGGTFNHNGGTAVFDGTSGTMSVNPPDTFNNLSLNRVSNTFVEGKIIVTGTLTLDDGFLVSGGAFGGGVAEIQNAIAINSGFDGGNCLLLITAGTGSPRTITFDAGRKLLPITLNASNVTINSAGSGTLAWRNLTLQSGTINQGSVAFEFGAVGFTGNYEQSGGTFNAGSQPMTFGINGGQFTQTGGTFNGSSGNLTFINVFLLSGGSFTASSNTTSFQSNFTHNGAGTFINNGGTVALDGDGGTIAVTQETFNNLTFNKTNIVDNAFMFLDGTMITTGTLLLNDGTFSALSNAKIEARGNVTVNSAFNGGNVPLLFTGSSNQIFTNNGGPNLTGTWTVEKSSGQVTLASNLILNNNQTLTITSGTLDQGPSFNLQTAGLLTIGAAGTLRNVGTGDFTLGNDLVNNGTLNINGGGSGCNDPNLANLLQINSTNTNSRTWSGSGIFSLVDVEVDRQTVGTPPPTSITAFAASHLTNTTGFLLDGGCPVTITTHPTNQSGCAGGPVSFNVAASGSGLTFRWRKNSVNLVNGGNISNATTPTLTINPTSVDDVGSYDAVVTNLLGITATSNAATLSLAAPPQVTQSPTDATRCPGQSVTFTAIATGDGLTFQWRKNGQAIVGATTSSLTIDPVSSGDAGSYDVVVSGTCSPPVTSAAATLTVSTPPAIDTQPTNQTACENGDASFSVAASGTGLTFQWRKNGTPLVNSSHIIGADTATLTIHQVVPSDADTYDVVVSGSCSPALTSQSRTLTVTSSMNIATQPISTSACEGALASFTAASSDATASVQWQVSTNGGGVFNNIPGATATTLSFTASAIQNGHQFRAVFTNSCSTANTSAATLTVNSPPSISSQPVNQTVCEGALASFSVAGNGSISANIGKRKIKRGNDVAAPVAGLSFQWRKNGTPLTNDGHFSGVDTPTLNIFPAVAGDAGSYDVVVSGSCSPPATSNAASLTVNGFALSAPSQIVPLGGGNGSVNVITDASCQWSAVSNDSFIHITSGSGGTGNGTVNFSVDPSAGPRTGTLTIAGLTFTVNQEGGQPLAPVIISEFRFRGSSGPLDEFIELYNNSDSPADISGYSLHTLTPDGAQTLVLILPGGIGSNTSVIPARGHYLIANTSSGGYSLMSVASPDVSYTLNIVDGSGVGLFGPGLPAANNRVDSVGFDTRDTLFFESTQLSPVGGITTDGEYSFVRQFLMTGGLPQDTNNNANDFVFVSTSGGIFNGRQSILGAPGPENLGTPILRNVSIAQSLIDPAVPGAASPNRVRDLTPDPVNNSTFGTLTIRRRFTNNTGLPVTRLRFRIMNITTFPSPGGGIADIRARTSADTVVTVTGGANVTVRGTTLDAPAQPMGGGYNGTLSAGTITLATPLAAGSSIDVQFLLGVQATGTFRFFVNIEAVTP